MLIVFSVLLVILGTVMMIRPKLFFDMTEGWKSSAGGEPSGLYLFSTRFGGIMCFLAGLAGIMVFLFLEK